MARSGKKVVICARMPSIYSLHFRILRNTLLLLSSQNLNISRNKLYIWNLQITCFKMISGENYQESEPQTSILPMICPRKFYF